MAPFVARFRERKLVQWALAYAAGAFAILQFVALVGGQFGWPPWLLRSITLALVFGFFATLVLAWYHGERGHQRAGGIELLMLGGILTVAGVAIAVVRGEEPPPAGAPAEESAGAPALLTSAVPPNPRSLAVLPFTNLSGDPENEYFSDGITEDILTQLAQVGDLRVISRTSVMPYKDTDKSMRQIGTELGVAHVLEGSVRRAGDRVRITAQLIHAQTDAHLWAEQYDRELEDIFAIQSEIAQQIAGALEAELSPAEQARLAAPRATDLTAYDYYLKGRDYFHRANTTVVDPEPANENAIRLFREALAVDSAYAPAHAGLADSYLLRAIYREGAWMDSALVSGERGKALDANLAEAYAVLGAVHWRGGEIRTGIDLLSRAVELEPSDGEAASFLAGAYAEIGRTDEGLRWAKRAVAVDPTAAEHYAWVGSAYIDLGLYPEAERWLREALQLAPDDYGAHVVLVQLYCLRGELEEADAQARAMLAVGPDDFGAHRAVAWVAVLRGDYARARRHYEASAEKAVAWMEPYAELPFVYRKLGELEKAEALLREGERFYLDLIAEGQEGFRWYLSLGTLYAVWGRTDEAIRWFDEAGKHGWVEPPRALPNPFWESLRGDARFERLLAEAEARSARQRERVLREGW